MLTTSVIILAITAGPCLADAPSPGLAEERAPGLLQAGLGLRETFQEPWPVDGATMHTRWARGALSVGGSFYVPFSTHRATRRDRDVVYTQGNPVGEDRYLVPVELDRFAASLSLELGRQPARTDRPFTPFLSLAAELRLLSEIWLGGHHTDLLWTEGPSWWHVSPAPGLGVRAALGERTVLTLTLSDRIRWRDYGVDCRWGYHSEALGCPTAVQTYVNHDFTLDLTLLHGFSSRADGSRPQPPR
jgi:hypothetical protein